MNNEQNGLNVTKRQKLGQAREQEREREWQRERKVCQRVRETGEWCIRFFVCWGDIERTIETAARCESILHRR